MFTVEWTDAAYDDLARIWTASDSARRQAINLAVQRLEARLQADPFAIGESLLAIIAWLTSGRSAWTCSWNSRAAS